MSILQLDKKIEQISAQINEYLSNINQYAYRSVYLISNEVLSRNINGNNFFKNLYFNKKPKKITTYLIFKNLYIYYKRSFSHFYWYIKKYQMYKQIIGKVNINNNKLYIFDTFLIVDKVLEDNFYKDSYFDGIYDVLDKENHEYIFLPVLIEGNKPSLKKIIKLFEIIKAKHDKNKFLFEFEILNVFEFLKIFTFILFYPIKLLMLKKYIGKDYIDELFWYEIIDSLKKDLPFYRYIRYIVGRKLDSKIKKKKYLISWYENQTVHKNLYKGLHDSKSDIFIFGSQPFVYAKNYFMFKPLNIELKYALVPDSIIVNGEYYLSSCDKCKVGPSFRSQKLYDNSQEIIIKFDCVVLLSYIDVYNDYILKLLNQGFFLNKKIIFKNHPASNYNLELPSIHWEILDNDIYTLMNKTDMVISGGSGTLIEATCRNKSVLVIYDNEEVPFAYLDTTLGYNTIWSEAKDKEELKKKYIMLKEYRSKYPKELLVNSKQYLKQYFTKFDIDLIKESYKF